MFNVKKPNKRICDTKSEIFRGESSYIYSVKWKDFVSDPESYIEKAYKIQSAIEQYKIRYDV